MIVEYIRSHARLVLALGLLATVAMAVVGGGAQRALLTGGTTDPGADSSLVETVVGEHAPALAPNFSVLVGTPDGPENATTREAGRRLTAVLDAEPTATSVDSYWSGGNAALLSDDGSHAVINAHLRGDESSIRRTLKHLRPALHEAGGGVPVELAGSAVVRIAVDDTIARDLLTAELIAIPITFALLFFVFGGLWAALLPVGVGVFAVMTTQAALRGVAAVTDVSVFALNLTTALGLGLAIDYTLLVVRRYREERATGAYHGPALARTMSTAGRTVAFSGVTVASALAVMLIFPLYFLRSFAYAGVLVVLAAMVGALVLTPAALTALQRRIGRPGRTRRRAPAHHGSGSSAFTTWVCRHARLVAPVSVLVLVLMALPFASGRFASSDERQLPASDPTRVAQTLINSDFGSARIPLAVVELATGTSADALRAKVAALKGVSGTSVVPAGEVDFLVVSSPAAPLSPGARKLVTKLREVVAPARVGGVTASLLDTQDAISRQLPWALGLVLAAALVLVFLLTGSIVLPVVTVLTNGLSLTAMFGAIVWVFQDGHLAGALGFTPTGAIDVTLPALLACVAFGLSMDYGVFVVARLVEERERDTTASPSSALLARSMQRTGGLITAAAVILATVLVAIGTSSITNTKMLGLGLALAVLVDATVVRRVVTPAVLTVLGPATWWAPSRLRALHGRIGWREERSTTDPTAVPLAAEPTDFPTRSPEPASIAG